MKSIVVKWIRIADLVTIIGDILLYKGMSEYIKRLFYLFVQGVSKTIVTAACVASGTSSK